MLFTSIVNGFWSLRRVEPFQNHFTIKQNPGLKWWKGMGDSITLSRIKFSNRGIYQFKHISIFIAKSNDLQFETIKLEYGGCDGSAYMLIFLPFENNSVDEFLHRFTSEALNNVMQNTSDRVMLTLSLPKMKFERRYYMEEVCLLVYSSNSVNIWY